MQPAAHDAKVTFMVNRERIKAFLTLLPSIILIAVFVYGFIGNTFWISLTDWGGVAALAEHPVKHYAGFANYLVFLVTALVRT